MKGYAEAHLPEVADYRIAALRLLISYDDFYRDFVVIGDSLGLLGCEELVASFFGAVGTAFWITIRIRG